MSSLSPVREKIALSVSDDFTRIVYDETKGTSI